MNKIPLTINELKSDSEFNYEIYTKEALISTIVSIRDYICDLEKELGSNNKRLSRVAENRYDKILELEQENQQLRNNWNDLKQFIDNAIYNSQYLYNLNTVNQYEDGINAEVYLNVAKKMEELERNNIDAYKR